MRTTNLMHALRTKPSRETSQELPRTLPVKEDDRIWWRQRIAPARLLVWHELMHAQSVPHGGQPDYHQEVHSALLRSFLVTSQPRRTSICFK
jgi:hypothetical protein